MLISEKLDPKLPDKHVNRHSYTVLFWCFIAFIKNCKKGHIQENNCLANVNYFHLSSFPVSVSFHAFMYWDSEQK